MNKRVVLIAILLLSLLAAAATVMARELTQVESGRAVALSPARAAGGLARLAQAATPTSTPLPAQTPAATPTPRVELDAPLMGSAAHPNAAGEAEYDVDRNGNSEIEVEIRGLDALAGQTVDVYIDGALAGSIVVGADGRGEFQARSASGQTVPVVTATSVIELRLGAEVVAASQFAPERDDDNGNDNDDNANDNDDDNVNDNDDDNINDNDDNANDNDDDNLNDNGDDNANDNGDDNDDNANDNHDDNVNDNDDHDDNGNHNGDDDHDNDNDDDHDNDHDDDDHGGGDDDDHGDD